MRGGRGGSYPARLRKFRRVLGIGPSKLALGQRYCPNVCVAAFRPHGLGPKSRLSGRPPGHALRVFPKHPRDAIGRKHETPVAVPAVTVRVKLEVEPERTAAVVGQFESP